MVKKLFAEEFHDAYRKSLKIKRLPTGARGVDAKAAWLFNWLIKNEYITPKPYIVVARCGVCGKGFDPKKWDGTIVHSKYDVPKGKRLPKAFGFVCPKCSGKVERAKKESGEGVPRQ